VYFWYRYYKYEQKLSSLFWKIEFKDIIIEDIDTTETDIKTKVRGFTLISASRFSTSRLRFSVVGLAGAACMFC